MDCPLCEVGIVSVLKPSPQWVTYRPVKDILLDLFNEDLNKIDWEHIESLHDVNSMVATFNNYILKLFDLHAPLKKVLIKEKCHPWITDTIKEMIRLRDKWQNRAKATGASQHINSYKELKYLVRAALQKPEHSLPHFCSDPEKINEHFLDVPGSGRVSDADLKYFEHHRFGNTHFQLEPVQEDTSMRPNPVVPQTMHYICACVSTGARTFHRLSMTERDKRYLPGHARVGVDRGELRKHLADCRSPIAY
ncbi:hypothetical protein HW555_013240 [Spodoptera exigua]|uniref:Uncharacterized protein n=1 Tax=Spodoptera exigua TaxID=7107 RepID=A0A835G535_SPOEX|nr:hypothetical protein HW555_013240 [Spodoptera exigua]